MKPRAVRVRVRKVNVRFNGRDASVVNISRSGMLLKLSDPAPLGSKCRLTLSQRSTTIEIDGKVVRQDAGETGEDTDGQHVGINFVSPPPPEVAALLRRLLTQG